MAEVRITSSGASIESADTFIIGNGDERDVSAIHVQLVSDSFSGSVSVVARNQSIQASKDDIDFVPAFYAALFVNGSAGTQFLDNTAITDTSEILVPASGRMVALDCTAYTSGSLKVYFTPLIGPVAMATPAAA